MVNKVRDRITAAVLGLVGPKLWGRFVSFAAAALLYLRQRLEDEGHDGGVAVLLVGRRLHPHLLGLGAAHRLYSPRLSRPRQPHALGLGAGRLNRLRPVGGMAGLSIRRS